MSVLRLMIAVLYVLASCLSTTNRIASTDSRTSRRNWASVTLCSCSLSRRKQKDCVLHKCLSYDTYVYIGTKVPCCLLLKLKLQKQNVCVDDLTDEDKKKLVSTSEFLLQHKLRYIYLGDDNFVFP